MSDIYEDEDYGSEEPDTELDYDPSEWGEEDGWGDDRQDSIDNPQDYD
jgi:hypothetical protein